MTNSILRERKPTIFTWGYGLTQGQWDIQSIMHSRRIDDFTIVDIRRTRGSRNKLWDLGNGTVIYADFSYAWEPHLGNHGRSARWIRDSNATAVANALERVAAKVARHDAVVLMCCESDPRRCHRREVANAISDITGAEIVDITQATEDTHHA